MSRIKNYVIYSFWVMIFCWVSNVVIEMLLNEDALEAFYTSALYYVLGFIWLTAIIFCFVNCIRHLVKKPKHKKFTITALCFSSYLILTGLVGFLMSV